MARATRVDFSDLLKIIDKIGKYSTDNRVRDPRRIPKMLKRLEKVWKKNPHLRLAQLILNAFTCAGPSAPYGRIYTVEDKELLAALEKFYKKNR